MWFFQRMNRKAVSALTTKRPLSVESLEPRLALSVSVIHSELPANSSIHGSQQTSDNGSAVAINRLGEAIVTYDGHGPGDDQGVFARRVGQDGTPRGADFLVNVTTRDAQESSVVATDALGNFVVAWSGRGSGDRHGIFIRRFGADGLALGGELLVNTTVVGAQQRPAIAMTDDGSFAVAWSGNGVGDVDGVFLRRFAADGSPLTGEVRGNETITARQDFASIAVETGGDLLISWSSRGQNGADWDVLARRFDTQGQALGPEFRVNESESGRQIHSSAAAGVTGDTFVAWDSLARDGGQFDVVGQRVSSAAQAEGQEFQINTTAPGNQMNVKLAAAPHGETLGVWQSGVLDGSGWEVKGQAFGADGQADGVEFGVNTVIAGPRSGHQAAPSVAMNDHSAIVAWSGRGRQDRAGVFYAILNVTPSSPPINHPPNLAKPADQTVVRGNELIVSATASDPDSSADRLTFSLDVDQRPEGATIDPHTGVFRWTPPANLAAGRYQVRILVTDDGEPPFADSETFSILVL